MVCMNGTFFHPGSSYLITGSEAEKSFSPHFVCMPVVNKWNDLLLVCNTANHGLFHSIQ